MAGLAPRRGRIKPRRPELRWRAEFSDPLLINIFGEERRGEITPGPVLDELRAGLVAAGYDPPEHDWVHDYAERLPYALADGLAFTNPNQAAYMLSYQTDPALRRRAESVSTVAAHPTLPPEFYRIERADYELEPGRAHLGYFGAFYPTRGLTEVTSALGSLSLEARSRVRLHVFSEKVEEVAGQIAEAGLADVITVNGYRPFLEFLNLITRFDVLLVNDATTHEHHPLNPYLPSKLSDYLGSGTAVWGLHEPGSVLSHTDLEFNTPLGDVAAASAVLAEIGRRWGVSDPGSRR